VSAFKDDFLARFRWIDGHADMLGLLVNAAFFSSAVEALAAPFRDRGITKVCTVEPRGLPVGAGVALQLGVRMSLLVDQLPDDKREALAPVHAVVLREELPPS
jgi:adenine/guanine phosphoribosyltransferase-like PRPP-binding protein